MRTVALYEMLFGILTLVGGVIGYATAGSVASLAAGLVTGIVLISAALKMQKGSKTGMYICLVVSLLVVAYFGMNFFVDNGKFMPAGLMTILGVISLLAIGILLVQPAERKRIY